MDPTNTHSEYMEAYNTTINIKLKEGEYKMYKVNEWNETITLIDDNVKVVGNSGYTYSAEELPQTVQFINKNSS